MCGIAGLLALAAKQDAAPPKIDHNVLKAMSASLLHRGPDGEGLHFGAGIGLAARRLSILDLTNGDQPIANEDRTIWVVHNGEIYNFEKLRKDLKSRGHVFQTRTDTEVIVHAYEEFGDDFVTRLRGQFAFAVWDSPQRRLLLVRDRVGIKQLFYTLVGQTLAWGSELKALLCVPGLERRMRPAALNQFLTLLYVPEPLTMFADVYELPASHMLVVESGRIKLRRYWELRYEPDPRMKVERAAEELRACLNDAVRDRLTSDVPVGAFLSGGIDSGSVVALMAHHCDEPVKTFSVGYASGGEAFDERRFAREVAAHYSTEHRELEIDARLTELTPNLVRAFDQPLADSSAIPSWYLCQHASQHVSVAISGLGGDEIVAGYERHRGAVLAERIGCLRGVIQGLLRPFAEVIPDSFGGRQWPQRIKRFLRSAALPFDDRYFEFLVQLTREARAELLTPELLEQIDLDEPRDHHNRVLLEVADADPLNRALYSDLRFYLPGNLLTLTDRISMAHSLEVRVPFLAQEVLELTARMPPDYKLRWMERKHILRQAVRDLLPKATLTRRKMGFSPPLAVWFRREHRSFVEDTLAESAVRNAGIFRYSAVRRLIDDHFHQRANYDNQIWALITFTAWYKDYIEGHDGFRSSA